MGSPAIFKGPKTQLITTEGIKLKNATDKDIVVGTLDPNATAQNADAGSLYMRDGSPDVFRKLDAGNTVAWKNLDIKPDVLQHLRADFVPVASLTTGSDPIFDNGGAFNGTLTRSTTAADLIDGLAVFKWVGNATPANNDDNFVVMEILNIPQGRRGQNLNFSFWYKWDGTDDNMVFRVKDTTNTAILSSDLLTLKQHNASNTAVRLEFSVFVPLTTAQVELGFQVLTGEVSPTLIWDDIAITSLPAMTVRDLDIAYSENFERFEVSDMSSGNNSVFDNGGALNGTITKNESTPISGNRSMVYTMGAASTNDWFHTGAIELDDKHAGEFFSATIYANYDGTLGDIKALVWDDTNDTELTSVEIGSVETNRFTMVGFIPATTTSLKFGFQVLVGNNTQILNFVDFQISLDPFRAISNGETIFSAVIQNNGSATILSESTPFLASATRAALGDVDLVFTTDHFNGVIPGVMATALFNGASDGENCSYQSLTAAGVTIRTDDVASGVNIDTDFAIMVTRQGADYAANRGDAIVVEVPSAANSMIRVQGANGYGSTNNKIRRWSTILEDIGNDIIFTQSATLGDFFTVQTDGEYSVSLTETSGGANNHHGMSVNTSEPTIAIGSLVNDADRRMIFLVAAANGNASAAWIGQLSAGDIIRGHNQGVTGGTSIWAQMTVAKIGTNQITGVPLPLVAYIKDVKASGNQGGTFTSGSYQTRVLNTLEGDSDFITLSSNQFTLPKGKYNIVGSAPAFKVANHKAKIQDVDNAVTAIMGSYAQNEASDNVVNHSFINGDIVITEATTFEFQHRCSVTRATNGFASAASFGDDEVFSQLTVTKVE